MSEVKAIRVHELKLDDEGHVIVAFAQLDAVDTDQDYTFPDAFPWGKELPISAYSHGSWPQKGGSLPTGRVELKEGGGWAVAEGKFFTDTTHGRDTYLTVKHLGPLQQWSYGYDVLATAEPPKGVKARRGLKSVDPHEISPVLLGAQPTAHTMAIKSADDDLFELVDPDASLKESLLAGLPFAEASSRLLADVDAFNRRVAAIHELRLKEGRALSGARLSLLQEHLGSLNSLAKTLAEMIEAANPKKDDDEAKAMLTLALRAKLRAGELASSALR